MQYITTIVDNLSEIFDGWRIFPRLLAVLFAYLMWQTHIWYTGLPVPTVEQSAYAGSMMLTAVGYFKFEFEAGKKT